MEGTSCRQNFFTLFRLVCAYIILLGAYRIQMVGSCPMVMSELNSQRYEYAVIAQNATFLYTCQKIDVVVFIQCLYWIKIEKVYILGEQ